MSTSHCPVEDHLCKRRVPRSQQCTMHDCGSQNAGLRTRTVNSETFLWTMRGPDASNISLRDPPLLESAWRIEDKSFKLPEQTDLTTTTTIERLSAQRETRMKHCKDNSAHEKCHDDHMTLLWLQLCGFVQELRPHVHPCGSPCFLGHTHIARE